MSPHRRKGRGGGGGKTMASEPLTSGGDRATDSPAKQHQQRRNPKEMLRVTIKSSLSTTAVHRSKSKEMAEPPRGRSVLPRATPLDSSLRSETKLPVDSRPECSSCPKSTESNGRVGTVGIDSEKKVENGPAKPFANMMSRGQSQSCRSSVQGDHSPDGLRWSSMSLPMHGGSNKTGNEVHIRQPMLPNASKHDGQGELMSSGSSKMSIANSLEEDKATELDSFAMAQASDAATSPAFMQNKFIGSALSSEELSHTSPLDGLSSFSSSLHQRLAVLEGKVKNIAAELKKTKEMLDTSNLAGSVALLSDIQGKILSIECAIASRSSNICSPEDAVMEDQFIPPCSGHDVVPDPHVSTIQKCLQASAMDSVFPEKMPLSEISLADHSTSAQVRDARLSYDQQNLEERLFPHRKLLKARFSPQEWAAKSRTLSHSKSCYDRECIGYDAMVTIDPASLMGTGEGVSTIHPPICFEHLSSVEINQMTVHSSTEVARGALVGKSTQSTGIITHSTTKNVMGKNSQLDLGQDACCIQATLGSAEHFLECDEVLPSSFYENQENVAPVGIKALVKHDDNPTGQLYSLGNRIATAGWYACESESIILAHDDGCCSFYDVANMEEKSVYKVPDAMVSPLWNDCWLVRAGGLDGQTNKYIVAVTSGSAIDCGFCSWDFTTRRLTACHCKDASLAPESPSICFKASYQRSCEAPQWWHRPCGPLMASARSFLKHMALFDIRDGDLVMTWHTKRVVASLDYCSPLQWRNKGKLILAEEEAISVWDVNTMKPSSLQYVEMPGKQIRALQMHNSDAESSGGVRQRLKSAECEAYDGVCCTQEGMYVLDFRLANSIGMRLCTQGQNILSLFARGNDILTGSVNAAQSISKACEVQQWSIRRAGIICTYAIPPSSSHFTQLAITQVWGSSDAVMAVNGNGLYIFRGWAEADEELSNCQSEEAKDVIGTQDSFNSSFDYANSRALLISRDRPACWCYWPT